MLDLGRQINDYLEGLDFIKTFYVERAMGNKIVVRVFWEVGGRVLASTMDFNKNRPLDYVIDAIYNVIMETTKTFVEGRMFNGRL